MCTDTWLKYAWKFYNTHNVGYDVMVKFIIYDCGGRIDCFIVPYVVLIKVYLYVASFNSGLFISMEIYLPLTEHRNNTSTKFCPWYYGITSLSMIEELIAVAYHVSF